MNGLTGMEKFSHLEDKIYLTIEFIKKLREEKENAASEAERLRTENVELTLSTQELETRIQELMSERDLIQLKVEAMIDAMTVIDPEIAEAVAR